MFPQKTATLRSVHVSAILEKFPRQISQFFTFPENPTKSKNSFISPFSKFPAFSANPANLRKPAKAAEPTKRTGRTGFSDLGDFSKTHSTRVVSAKNRHPTLRTTLNDLKVLSPNPPTQSTTATVVYRRFWAIVGFLPSPANPGIYQGWDVFGFFKFPGFRVPVKIVQTCTPRRVVVYLLNVYVGCALHAVPGRLWVVVPVQASAPSQRFTMILSQATREPHARHSPIVQFPGFLQFEQFAQISQIFQMTALVTLSFIAPPHVVPGWYGPTYRPLGNQLDPKAITMPVPS